MLLRALIGAVILCGMGWWTAGGPLQAAERREVLQSGDRGSSVLRLQQYLASLGYDIELAGTFGPRTEAVVREFQKQTGLRADGVVGEATWDKLESMVVTYTVRRGDTLWSIAARADTDVATLRRLNRLENDRIQAGQKLLLPQKLAVPALSGAANDTSTEPSTPVTSATVPERSATTEDPPLASAKPSDLPGDQGFDPPPLTHQVKKGETLTSIARQYGTTVSALLRVNPLPDPDRLQIGQELRLPLEVAARSYQVYPGSLLWPVLGRISSDYGERLHPITGQPDFHEGIDIAVPPGTPVRAAAGGRVVTAGWMGGYGYGVVIEHAGGIETLYGHNSRLLVEPGTWVQRGQVIAYSGSTGLSTGPHVDFRIKVRGEYVNPHEWLP